MQAQAPSTAEEVEVHDLLLLEAVERPSEPIDSDGGDGGVGAPDIAAPVPSLPPFTLTPANSVLSSAASTKVEPSDSTRSVQSSESTSSSSRKVLLVSKPSQRDIQVWTRRASSSKLQRQASSVRVQASSELGRRWEQAYKPTIAHSGWLIKRGHSIRNFKRRLFFIIDHQLVYHGSHDAADLLGRIDLRKKTSMQCLRHGGFQLMQGTYQMILYAIDAHERDEWIDKLRDEGVELRSHCTETSGPPQRMLSGDDESPIVFSGWLRKRGQRIKSIKRRWFELSSTTLTYFKDPQGGAMKGEIVVTNAKISSMDTLKSGERFSFKVISSQRELVLHADSQEERSLWIASLSWVAEGATSTSDPSESFSTMKVSDDMRWSALTSSTIESLPSTRSEDARLSLSTLPGWEEDGLADVKREVALMLASPYSTEGSSSAAFVRKHALQGIGNVTLKQFMAGLSDYMVSKRLHELRLLGGCPSTSTSDVELGLVDDEQASIENEEFVERILEIINEQIEERVYFPLCRFVIANILTQVESNAQTLRGKLEVLRTKSQLFFGIGSGSISPSGWESACIQLREVDHKTLPYMKRRQLVHACHEIYATHTREHPDSGPMSADDFIPAFIFVLVQARLENPLLLKELLTAFDLSGTQGEATYFVTCLEIALEYIRSLLIASNVVLDASHSLGIDLVLNTERNVVVVRNLTPGGQAEKCGAINVRDVLVAINGVIVNYNDLETVSRMVQDVEGSIELCFLSMEEYEKRFGTVIHPAARLSIASSSTRDLKLDCLTL